jgi:formylglycine-generating enzyme required for sulfatase activity
MTPKKFDRLLPKLLLATVGVLLIMSPYVWAERGVVLFPKKTDAYYPEKRVALVIGNSKYQEKPLQNATNDAKDIAKDGGKGPKMVWIPGGSFQMGGSGSYDEKPVHEVSVGHFAMGVYEVTFAEYDKFAKAAGRKKSSDNGWGRGNRPVINVSWDDATVYAKWLSGQTGKKYRLPTEAEWEYSARAGTSTKYWWGNTASHEYANYGTDRCCSGLAKGKDRWEYTSPVGSFAPNSFGLYDTVGNVWEWVRDFYDRSYYSNSPPHDPKGPSRGKHRVLRGCAWGSTASYCRVANRIYEPDGRYILLGLRLLRQPQ